MVLPNQTGCVGLQLVCLAALLGGTGVVATSGPLPGLQIWTQAWILDAAGPQGVAASNAVRLSAP